MLVLWRTDVSLSKSKEEVQPKSVAEFSLYVSKAAFDKKTQERRWSAVTSDIDPDSYDDEMSLELYSDFEKRSESKELPPESHRSDFWSGGLPYLSISHYLDLNGTGVPGPTDQVWTDGNCFKAKGRLYDTELGRACFNALCKDLYGEEKSDHENKIRISIAFVDWAHRHKSNGFEFVRESLDDICSECLKELFTGEAEGKIFLRGHLIHLALTREPVNKRTSMEVRSMVTQKEDAASIVGEEEAEKLAEKAKDELKADLVIKAEQKEVEPVVEEAKASKDDEKEDEEDDKKKKKKEEKSVVINNSVAVEKTPHVLDPEVKSFLDAYDVVSKSGFDYSSKLKAVQDAYEQFGTAVAASFAPTKEEKEFEALDEIKSMLTQLLSRQDATEQKLAILEQKNLSSNPKELIQPTTVRRSLQFDPATALDPAQHAAPGSIKAVADRSAGIYN